MALLKQFTTGIEIPLCTFPSLYFPAAYVGILKQNDYVTIEHEGKTYDLLVNYVAPTADYACKYHEGARHVRVDAREADNLDLLYFFNNRNKERKARREAEAKEKKAD